jgi:hypothetical protein
LTCIRQLTSQKTVITLSSDKFTKTEKKIF